MFSKSSATNSSSLTATPAHAGLEMWMHHVQSCAKKVTVASKNEKTAMSQVAEGTSDF